MLELLSTACTLAEQRSPLAQICVCLSFRSHIHTLMSKRICGCPSLKPCEFRVTWAQIPIDRCKLSIRAEAMGKVRNAMKKPASSRARAPRATLPGMMTSQCIDVLAAWIAGELGSLPETNRPDWCEHALTQVDKYMRLVAAAHKGQKLWINVWSDCVCMGTEMEAGAILGKKLKDRYDLDCELAMFFACDTDGKCMDYVKRNYSPTHTAADVFKRNWTDGNLVLSTGDLLEFPRPGAIDLYVAGFTCGPWSFLGNRLGFSTKAGHLCFAVLKTIDVLKPAFYIVENVLQVGTECSAFTDETDQVDYKAITDYFNKNLPNYESCTVHGLDPSHAGYPIAKPRLYQVGGRSNVGQCGRLTECLNTIMSNPMPILQNYKHFLGLPPSDIDFSRLGCLPAAAEIGALAYQNGVRCSCSVNPYVVCEVHPCTCIKCTPEDPLACQWRSKAFNFLKEHFGENVFDVHNLRKLTYCNILELHGKKLMPSPRQRNMLNIVANLPRLHPIKDTIAVIDVSQAIDRIRISTNGLVPTHATNSEFFCLCDGRILNTMQIAYLMGHDVRSLNLTGVSKGHLKHMLGMGFHVSSIGVCLVGLIASTASGAD